MKISQEMKDELEALKKVPVKCDEFKKAKNNIYIIQNVELLSMDEIAFIDKKMARIMSILSMFDFHAESNRIVLDIEDAEMALFESYADVMYKLRYTDSVYRFLKEDIEQINALYNSGAYFVVDSI